MRRDENRLRSRLVAALVAATAIAFVVTVAAVAASPAPSPDDTAAGPSSVGPSDAATTPATSLPPRAPAGEPRPEPRGANPPAASGPDDPADAEDGTEDGAEASDPVPASEPAPAEPPPSAEPRPSSDADRAPAPTDHGARLWGRWYRADEIREDDVRVRVAGDHPLYVGFVRQEGGDGLVWMTSCNTFGGDLAVGRERLRVRDIGGTADACEDENQHDQEEWLVGFFGAGPRWLTAGDQLRMWTPDGRRIDLFEDPEGPGPPWS